ncbi:protein kinase C delta type-like [Aquarana catesbeiana]|uniref:protein kinase C delta type-like n=1 Tax=Aquarana catesbeiana TaxID=8400 RepID=UPI003CCA5600
MVHKRNPIDDNPDRVLNERIVMEIAGGSRFCTCAYATFQTEDYIFYVMDYMRGGDMVDIMQAMEKVDPTATVDLPTLRLLTAEIVCGLQYLHSRGIVHRDMKVDNILVDSTGHVQIADYGLAATNVYGYNMVTEILGRLFNAAPEMIFRLPYDGAVDYFALGILLFDLAFKQYPFEGRVGDVRLIKHAAPRNIPGADPDLMDFLEKLLCKDPCRRNDFIADIQDHPFFNGINWKEVEAGEARPPIFVRRKGFRNLTREKINPEDLMNNMDYSGRPMKPLSAEEQKLFDGFSFVSEKWKSMQKLK